VTLRAKAAAMMNTKMTRSEKIVTGIAVAVLVAGFATGVFARPINPSPQGPGWAAHVISIELHRDR
jgi:hypothetical protein